ncbi:acyl-CoA thioesterase [Empedobacter tilapiae]|uniref:Acyl-CoA thioesterase n=1 Tax=Empedobacter tilapiae TaxID=2491114 RepID=A0A4Z1B8P7_9FLAO|nr:acyl-CoA thioesterase [Empedobacter tilapiae]TGN27806.1 acyl-CoA thioesterase [Empedobacter tilapiae]
MISSEEKIKKLVHNSNFAVRFNETDPLGIVWHGNYITYFEDGREAFGRHFGISYLDIQKSGFVTPIIKSVCEHKFPLKYGDICRIETTFENTLAAKMIYKFKIFNQDDKLVCIGETIQVFLDSDGELMLTLPPFFEEWKKKVGLL